MKRSIRTSALILAAIFMSGQVYAQSLASSGKDIAPDAPTVDDAAQPALDGTGAPVTLPPTEKVSLSVNPVVQGLNAPLTEKLSIPELTLTPELLWEKPITVDLRNIDALEALKYVAQKGNLNIVATRNVSGRVTLSLQNIPLKDIFDFMLRSNGLAYVKQGDIYSVMTEAEYKALYGKSFSDIRVTKVIRLKYAIPEQAFSLLDALKSEVGRVLVDQESGNVLMLDTPERISDMEKALEEFEKQNTIEVFRLQYAKAKEVEEILKTRLDVKKVGSIKADERNNQIIIQTLPERMEEMRRLIKDLDRQTKEVLIDAKIIRVTLSDQADRGVEWEGIMSVFRKNGLGYFGTSPFSTIQPTTSATAEWLSRYQQLQLLQSENAGIGSIPFSGTTTTYNSSTPNVLGDSMHFGIINGKNDYDIAMKLLDTIGQTRILATPKIVAVNNQEAKLHVGERQAYVTTTTSTGQTTSTISEEVTFVDVGIQLAVTPSINDDGMITMKIRPEISSVSSKLVTPTKNSIPIINTSLAETTVMVRDGNTVIVGGLRQEEKADASSELPGTGKIPFVNLATKRSTKKTTRTELLILLTPHILTGKDFDYGDERVFGDKPGKEDQVYEPLVKDRSMLPQGDQSLIRPKAMRDELTLTDRVDTTMMKGYRYERN